MVMMSARVFFFWANPLVPGQVQGVAGRTKNERQQNATGESSWSSKNPPKKSSNIIIIFIFEINPRENRRSCEARWTTHNQKHLSTSLKGEGGGGLVGLGAGISKQAPDHIITTYLQHRARRPGHPAKKMKRKKLKINAGMEPAKKNNTNRSAHCTVYNTPLIKICAGISHRGSNKHTKIKIKIKHFEV